ncbi:hypothetical protein FS837_008760 [Tulasnella sp. UAMH 9824]|nr:hypothetical protein FS837_008760 [Tulasnella sp. UAMH 9824]
MTTLLQKEAITLPQLGAATLPQQGATPTHSPIYLSLPQQGAVPLPHQGTVPPNIPKEFGEDGGHFYKYYDDFAEEIDEDLVNRLKSQLDGILIFAGLFAGVNAGFLALTLPLMSPDPADDTNALLLRIARGDNSSITSAEDLPSASFTPPPRIYPINALFSVSLTLALFSSFFAVLGQQWLVYYRKRGGGGPEYQRWEQLRRHLGAKQWKLEMVLDDLVPSMLQLGLVIFCISFALYLGTLSESLNRMMVALLCVGGATLVALSACVTFDPWCPFNVPWSRIVRPVVCWTAAFVKWFGVCGVALVFFIPRSIIAAGRTIIFRGQRDEAEERRWENMWNSEVEEFKQTYTAGLGDDYMKFSKLARRSPKSPDDLKIIALRRLMCTSEDRSACFYSALNLQSIWDQQVLSSLAKDVEFRTRLIDLYQEALDGIHRRQTGRLDAKMNAVVLSASFSHFLIMASSVPHLSWTRVGTNPSQIIYLGNLPISPSQIRDLNSISESSDCADLRFCISVVQLLVEGFKDPQPTSFNGAFTDIVGALTQVKDLRLGCVVASVILSSKKWCDVPPAHLADWPRSELLEKLFDAYRTKDEWEMFQKISEALDTASGPWRVKPDHEIYAGLFDLRLSLFDAPLLSIERRIRDKNTLETDRERLRELRARCVQSVADSLRSQEYSLQRNLIDAPLERYLDSIKELMGLEPGHFENSRTMNLFQDIEKAFWPGHEQQKDPQNGARLKLRQILHGSSNISTTKSAVQVAEDDSEKGHNNLQEIVLDSPPAGGN